VFTLYFSVFLEWGEKGGVVIEGMDDEEKKKQIFGESKLYTGLSRGSEGMSLWQNKRVSLNCLKDDMHTILF